MDCKQRVLAAAATVVIATGCQADDGGGDDAGMTEPPADYGFDSRFGSGSSVSYSGQTFRQVLVARLGAELTTIDAEIADGAVFAAGDVEARLRFYYAFDGDTAGSVPHGMMTTPPTMQTTWADISTGKDLQSKIAGNDAVGQHEDWATAMVGWTPTSPDGLVQTWFAEVDALAVTYSSGEIPLDPNGVQIEHFYVSSTGLDYQQLLSKFLLGVVNYSQGTDDYLDDDVDGKGLLSDHVEPDGDEPFTALEHAWDEGFGYWGGARNYLDYTDDEIAGAEGRTGWSDGYNDWNADGVIDLKSEYNFSAAVNAAKRDRGSAVDSPTDITETTMQAFLAGRAIIASADGALTPTQLTELQAQRDVAVLGWEQAIAATVVHYINEVIVDMAAPEYDFAGHAKHWSELKGFALILQFNPRSQLTDEEFATLHQLLGMAPVFPGDPAAAQYSAGLLAARDLLGRSYGFAAANLGDANGENGW